MTSNLRLGSLSAPPHPAPQLLLTISAPLPEAFAPAPPPQSQPQAVVVEEAAQDNLDNTNEYWIEGDDVPEVAANTIVFVDALTQWSRPPSRPTSAAAPPNPVVGICISGVVEAIITSAAPVYAPRQRLSSLPPPPPLYVDSAPRVHRRPPLALLVQRPRTRSTVGDGPLLKSLLSDTRCLW